MIRPLNLVELNIALACPGGIAQLRLLCISTRHSGARTVVEQPSCCNTGSKALSHDLSHVTGWMM